jgi:crotonobetainyl-CoA:carnitine CoA-transferase CaiB-like acyl-CoA transferase
MTTHEADAAPGPGPLTGLRVLDLSRMYPGACCTLLLADLGAEIVKVEAPGFGDGIRAMAPPGSFNATHIALNRGKRSVVLDLRKPEGAEVLRRLVQDADVLVESHKPGALDSSGIGCDAMREINPRLIWCSITGFGSSGPNATAAGHDITYLGYSGLMSRLSQLAPTPPAVSLSLPMAAMTAALGILAALERRHRTGNGGRVDANMVDSAMWALAEEFTSAAASGTSRGWGDGAGRNVFRCADGRYVTVAATEPKSWAALVAGLGVPELADYRMGTDEAATTARLAAVFATRAASDWIATPGLAGGIGPVNEPADLLADPQLTERSGLVALADGSGVRVLASPVRIDNDHGTASTRAVSAPPGLGADTDAVLTAAGYTADEIATLRVGGVV